MNLFRWIGDVIFGDRLRDDVSLEEIASIDPFDLDSNFPSPPKGGDGEALPAGRASSSHVARDRK